MSLRISHFLDEFQPFSENMLVKVRDRQGNLVSIKNIRSEFTGKMDEAVLVLELSNRPKKLKS